MIDETQKSPKIEEPSRKGHSEDYDNEMLDATKYQSVKNNYYSHNGNF